MVEQWPFKPFVTGSNPVRPKLVIYFVALTLFCIITSLSVAAEKQVTVTSNNNIKLTGELLSTNQKTSVFLIVHGTRGHKGMELSLIHI